MTTTVTPPARTLRPPRKARSNGQWALDGRKPLNDNEAFKQDGDPPATRASHPTISTAVSAGGVCTPSASRGSTAAAPPSWTPPSSPTATSCSGCAWTVGA